jgi:hypothetical protein
MKLQRSFLERFASEPDVGAMLAMLVSDAKLRLGERYLLFSGFRAWVQFPGGVEASADREQQMIMAVVRRIGAIEQRAIHSQSTDSGLAAIHNKRVSKQHRWLYEEIFLPSGGIGEMLHLRSALRHAVFCNDQQYKLQTCYRLIAIAHEIVTENKERRRRLSINEVIRQYGRLYSDQRGKSPRHLWDIWQETRAAAPFIYAGLSELDGASLVPPPATPKRGRASKRTVPWTVNCSLKRIPAFPKGYLKYAHDFSRLVARAKFVDHEIMSRFSADARNEALVFPDSIQPEIVLPPSFKKNERATIATPLPKT